MDFDQNIEIRVDKHFGQPCIKNTRITVADILTWLVSGMNISENVGEFPELKDDDIKAALLYAAQRKK